MTSKVDLFSGPPSDSTESRLARKKKNGVHLFPLNGDLHQAIMPVNYYWVPRVLEYVISSIKNSAYKMSTHTLSALMGTTQVSVQKAEYESLASHYD